MITFHKGDQRAGIILEDTLYPGHFFSRLDSTNRFGFEYSYTLTNDDRDKNIRLILSGKVRTNFVYTTGAIAYVTVNGDQMTSWDGSNMHYHITDLNTWCHFKEEVNLPKPTSGYPYTKIGINGLVGENKKEYFDFDSIRIQLVRFE